MVAWRHRPLRPLVIGVLVNVKRIRALSRTHLFGHDVAPGSLCGKVSALIVVMSHGAEPASRAARRETPDPIAGNRRLGS